MKLINLLIKMSKGNYPNVFNYDGYYWRLEDDAYFNECDEQLEDYCTITRCLNEEVEIIEGDKINDKK